MDQDDRRAAEALIRDTAFQSGLSDLLLAFVRRWSVEGAGMDAVSVAVGTARGEEARFLIVCTPVIDGLERELKACERAFYRAAALQARSRKAKGS